MEAPTPVTYLLVLSAASLLIVLHAVLQVVRRA